MMRVWSVLLTCVQLVLWLHMGDAAVISCVQNGDLDFRPDSGDCAVFHRCAGTTLYKFTCKPGTVFSPEIKVCVHKGSADDTCTTASEDGNPTCQTRSDTLIPHKDRCSLYYNCSAPAKASYWEEHLQECQHPQVYNTDTRRCEHYSMVDCGEREMPLGPCEYKITECVRGHCRPCYVDSPSCRNLNSGLQAHPDRPNSPFYIICLHKRLVYQDRCESYDGKMPLFDPERNICVLM